MFVYPASDQLPGEPTRLRASTLPFALRLLGTLLSVVLVGLLTAAMWPLFLVGVALWGWPPHQPRPSQVRRFLGHALWERPSAPGIAPLSRVWLVLAILRKALLIPAHGLAWYLDEVLFGHRLAQTQVVAPLIVLSAARSGSTQIAHYLEEDPRLTSPAVLQILCPYLWMWRLAPLFRGLLTADRIQALYHALITEEFQQRHEGNPLRTDTFEVLFFMHHLNMLAGALGPRVMAEELAFVGVPLHMRRFWEVDLIDFIDRLGRKTILAAGPGAAGAPRRLFIKGHFLAARHALARRYPDACFLTVTRDPLSRLQSMVNHIHANSFAEPLGAIPWRWIAEGLLEAEIGYCQQEQAWFTAPAGPTRIVIRFTDYIADLEGTMRHIYRVSMDEDTLPAHVPTAHVPRERSNYRVNRSLEQVGIDRDLLATRLADYRAWCR